MAVADAVAALAAPAPVAVKWPNDVLLDGRKCCGMLPEAVFRASAPPTVILGIGLNVNQSDFPPDLADRATSLLLVTGRPVPRARLFADLLARLERRYDQALEDPDALRQLYTHRLAGVGRTVRLHAATEARAIEGVLLGITPQGALRLQTPDGEQTFHAGEVTTHAR